MCAYIWCTESRMWICVSFFFLEFNTLAIKCEYSGFILCMAEGISLVLSLSFDDDEKWWISRRHRGAYTWKVFVFVASTDTHTHILCVSKDGRQKLNDFPSLRSFTFPFFFSCKKKKRIKIIKLSISLTLISLLKSSLEALVCCWKIVGRKTVDVINLELQ